LAYSTQFHCRKFIFMLLASAPQDTYYLLVSNKYYEQFFGCACVQ